MNEEEKIISMNLGVLIEDNIDVIFTDLKKNIFKLLCKSIYITSFNIFSNLLYDEINSFIAFLKTDDIEIPCSYGKFAVSKGLDEDIIFTFLDVILYFILDHYDNLKIALKLFYRYMKYYIIAFYKEKKNKRDLSQNQLYKTLNDIIEVQQKEILEKEKEQNRQRTAFLINLAHETKLPLTILENQINMVKEEAGKRQLQTVLPLEEQIKELQEMIGNILDYEKILQGKMLYNHDIIVNLSKTVVSKVELFKVITDKMNICIRQEILGELHIRIAPLALDRILNNVLDNAIKYNHEKGSIHITVKGDDSSVFFIVRDTGIGIPLDQIQHLFEPYYQCTHKKRSNQGIGAGLALVKSILEEVSGNITIHSIVDQGTTVTITFKKAIITKDDKMIENIQISKPITRKHVILKDETYDDKKKTILFVEDNIELLSHLQQRMINDFNFYYAVNGRDALSRIEIIPRPDVIISDIMMDVMDGYEFLSRLRERHDFQDIPFIFLTAKTTEEDKLKGLKYGAVDYIEKPFSVAVLKEKIKSLIRDHEVYSETEIEKMEKKLLRSIRTKESTETHFELLSKRFDLSSREQEIIQYIIRGMDNKDIAEKLFISIDTVKSHFQKIKIKCKVKNKIQLANLFRL